RGHLEAHAGEPGGARHDGPVRATFGSRRARFRLRDAAVRAVPGEPRRGRVTAVIHLTASAHTPTHRTYGASESATERRSSSTRRAASASRCAGISPDATASAMRA